MSYGRALGKPPFPVVSALSRVNRQTERNGTIWHSAAQWSHNFRRTARPLAALGWLALIANEIRGLILAGPILYAMAQANSLMALWVGFCALAGIVASVAIPLCVARWIGL